VAIVAGDVRDYAAGHPATAVLVVEVADTSLEYDRTVKAAIYARAAIPEYWVLNLIDRQLEIFRDPQPDGYAARSVLPAGARAALSVRPAVELAVAELLP
jgi:Uma2 family endonuclease